MKQRKAENAHNSEAVTHFSMIKFHMQIQIHAYSSIFVVSVLIPQLVTVVHYQVFCSCW